MREPEGLSPEAAVSYTCTEKATFAGAWLAVLRGCSLAREKRELLNLPMSRKVNLLGRSEDRQPEAWLASPAGRNGR